MTVLNKNQIIERIYSKDKNKRIVITPLINDKQIGLSTVDLRLGNTFIMFESTCLLSTFSSL